MTVDDHKRAVTDGLEIMHWINKSTQSKNKQFIALGDPNTVEVKCFWYKERC
jgi:aspartyl/asparaginyl-tRNA synthetase